jgi:uncharacterized membrane protein
LPGTEHVVLVTKTLRHDARDVLDDRLARGDIDVEDYQRRRSLLTDDGVDDPGGG